MADIQHADLPDDKLHEVKGAAAAQPDTWLKAVGDGSTVFDTLPLVAPKTLTVGDTLLVSDHTSQMLSSVGSETSLKFGSGVTSSGGSIETTSGGVVTFLRDGFYHVVPSLQAGRTSDTGVAELAFCKRIRGSQVGNTSAISVSSSTKTFSTPVLSPFIHQASAGDSLTFHMARHAGDGTGDAGIRPVPVVGISGWQQAPSASLQVTKIEVVNV